MKFTFSQDIRLMRFLWRFKQTYAYRSVIHFYFCQPFAVFFSHAKKTAFTAPATSILRIFLVRNLAQIRKLIVGAVSIDMVNLICRPLTINVKPSQTVRQIQYVIQSDTYISVFHFAPRHVAQSATTSNFSPRKQTSVWVIAQKFFKSFGRHAVNINPVVCGGQA